METKEIKMNSSEKTIKSKLNSHSSVRSIGVLAFVLAALMLFTILQFGTITSFADGEQWDGSAATSFSDGGTGSSGDPYKIGTAAELKLFANIVNGQNLPEGFAQKTAACAILTTDIVLNTGDVAGCNGTKADGWQEWTPIGYGAGIYFGGTFDGKGHTVSGLYINNENYSSVGLFGMLSTYNSGMAIQNLGIENSYIKGNGYVGGICGYNNKSTSQKSHTIINCYNTGTVVGDAYAIGGICGKSYGIISNCFNIGTVIGGTYSVGGVCGENSGTVSNCYYLTGCAKGSNGVPQFGLGNTAAGKTTADVEGKTAGKDADAFSKGEVCYLLNGSRDAAVDGGSLVWYQNLAVGGDNHPVLTEAEGTIVHANNVGGNTVYTNSGSHVHIFENGFCYCGGFQPAELNKDDNYYEISNAGELYWFAAQVNAGNNEINARLMENIDLNPGYTFKLNGQYPDARVWTPIGKAETYLRGTFDGNGHTISGVYINNETDISENYIAIFTCLPSGSTVKNLGVINSYLYKTQKDYIGGIAGRCEGEIINCYNAATLRGSNSVGGICGYLCETGKIENCYNVGMIVSTYGTTTGIAGQNIGATIKNCYFLKGSATYGYNINYANFSPKGEAEETGDDVFATGKVTWYLNGGENQVDPLVWFQKIGTDAYPTLASEEGNTVYGGYATCIPELEFSNTVFPTTIEHKLADWKDNGDGTHVRICTVCNTVIETEAHTVTVWTVDSNDESKHSGTCAVCGATVTAGHNVTTWTVDPTDANKHKGTCTACGEDVCQEHTYVVNLPNETQHRLVCSACNQSITEDHTFDANGFCTACNTVKPATKEDDYYIIENLGNLYWFASKSNIYNYYAINARLDCDLVLDNSFPRIGRSAGAAYSGIFDGNGHTITLNYTYSNLRYVGGLFDYVYGATIQNLIITGTIQADCFNVGGLVGTIGGGKNKTTIKNVLCDVDITSDLPGSCYYNGIVDTVYGTVEMTNCGYTGTITAKKGTICSGLIGKLTESAGASFTGCYMTGTLDLKTTDGSATFCCSNATYTNCYYITSYGTVQGEEMTDDKFASGEVTYLLNGGITDGTQGWYQTVGVGLPALSGDTVYGGYTSCKSEKSYSNSALSIVELPHTFDESSNGFCKVCGVYEAAKECGDVYEIYNAGQFFWFANKANNFNNSMNGKLMNDIDLNPGYTFTFESDTGLVVLEYNGDIKGYFGTGKKGESGGNSLFDETASVKGAFYSSKDSTVEGTAPADLNVWTPIGSNVLSFNGSFNGNFNGNGKTVSGLYYNNISAEIYVGLFKRLNANASVSNISIINSYIVGNVNVGGVVSYNYKGTISNCSNSGIVVGNAHVGGVCGFNTGIGYITDCYNIGTVVGNYNVGSVSGFGVPEAIKNCYYLTGCATDGSGTVQFGTGTSEGNAAADVSGATIGKSSEKFASGEVAWLLNTAGKNVGEEGYNHTGVWSQSADYPIFADDENKAVYKVGITGAASKAYYLKAGDSFTMPENIYSATYTETVNVSADVFYVADAAIASAQPKLGTSITMIYTAKVLTSLVGENTLQMVFNFTGKTYTVDGTAGAADGDYTYYSFCFNRVAPQFMGEMIDASLTIGENTITKTGYSLEIYCDTMLAKSDDELEAMLQGNTSATVEELKTLLNDILLYGAASQVYKDYKTDALVGNLDNLTFEAIGETDRLISGNGNKDAYFTAVGLSFDNINKIYWKISVSIVNLKNVTVNIYREGDDTPIAAELTRVSNGVYIVYSEDITAREFGVKYTAEIVYDGNVAQSATYSVNSYVYSKQTAETEIGTLVKALCNYGKSTAAYVAE